MNEAQTIKISKLLSLALRHNPDTIGITLDEAGWTPVAELLAGCARHGIQLSLSELEELVASSDKQRFAFSEDKKYIRANQGHSVSVELGLAAQQPPAVLYHGTVEKFLRAIRKEGLKKGQRHHVHLSANQHTAEKVGERRGHPVILRIDAERMHADGFSFFLSANGVWLTEHVPSRYIA